MRFKKTTIVAISLIFIFCLQFTFAWSPGYLQADNFGNIMGGAPWFSGQTAFYEWDKFDPAQKYAASMVYRGLDNRKIIACEETTSQCYVVEGDKRTETNYRNTPRVNNTTNNTTNNSRGPVNYTRVDYFTQDCIDVGFIKVSGYPFTYKCTDDKTGYYVCYKDQKSGHAIEPNPYPFSKPLETNRLRKAICDLRTPDIEETPVDTTRENTTEETLDNSNTISDAVLAPSLIEKVGFVAVNSETGTSVFPIKYVDKTNIEVPHFVINSELLTAYIGRDIKIEMQLDENGFNFNENIYMLIANEENYDNIIPEINKFVSTNNSEYSYYQGETTEVIPYYNVSCNCKYRKTADSEIKYFPMSITFANLNLINGELDATSKKSVNNSCVNACEVNQKEVKNNAPGLYEYDLEDYELFLPETRETVINYKLTQPKMDKIKFKLNGNLVQFKIEPNSPYKKFVVVFLQKSDKKLNIAYANIFILTNDEILSYSHCELNRKVLNYFCRPGLDSRCEVIKNCYNGYHLNYEDIDLTSYVSSGTSGSPTTPQLPNDNEQPQQDVPNLNEGAGKYYSTRNNTKDACSNANLTTNQWGCVCIIQQSGAKRVVPAKCTSNYGLVLYGTPDRGKVPTAYQFCYNEPSTKCR